MLPPLAKHRCPNHQSHLLRRPRVVCLFCRRRNSRADNTGTDDARPDARPDDALPDALPDAHPDDALSDAHPDNADRNRAADYTSTDHTGTDHTGAYGAR